VEGAGRAGEVHAVCNELWELLRVLSEKNLCLKKSRYEEVVEGLDRIIQALNERADELTQALIEGTEEKASRPS
jgi:cob(I)alamin adenosyltransferase